MKPDLDGQPPHAAQPGLPGSEPPGAGGSSEAELGGLRSAGEHDPIVLQERVLEDLLREPKNLSTGEEEARQRLIEKAKSKLNSLRGVGSVGIGTEVEGRKT